LAITQDLVELMGGAIAVDSQKGSGTTFVVTLPLEMP
jgi:signal transduction histidine kinase